jgi:hypothetical protein
MVYDTSRNIKSVGNTGGLFRLSPASDSFLFCRIFVGKQEGKGRHRWVDNIKKDLRKIGWGGVDWIDLAHSRD